MSIKIQQTVFRNKIEDNPYNSISANIGQQKGDLIVFTEAGNAVRFSAGSANGKTLITDNTTETGWTLGTPGGGTGATATLYNGTGATITAGTVVTAEVPSSPTITNPEIAKATATSAGPYYILNDSVANGDTVQASFAEDSVVSVLCDTSAVSQGDALVVSSSAGLATALANGTPTIGIALSAKASGSTGMVKCRMVKAPQTIGTNTDALSNTAGQVYEVASGSTTADTPDLISARKGKYPYGVQANAQSASAGTVLLHSRPGDYAMVMADTTEIKIGDWLVPSAITDGQVRNGSGYGIGVAMTAKASGAQGLVKCLLYPGQYRNSPRAWYLPAGITEAQVAGAYQFINVESEANALININEGTEYALSKVLGTETWNTATGFTIPASKAAGLTNSDLMALHSSVLTGVIRFSDGYIGTSDITQGGLSLDSTWYFAINGARSGAYYHKPVISQANGSTLPNHTSAIPSGTQKTSGVYGAEITTDGSVIYYDGTANATSQLSTNTGFAPSGTPAIGQQNISGITYNPFNVQAVVFYTTQLTASQHLELATAMNAL